MRARTYQLLESGEDYAPFGRVIDVFLIALICLNVAAAILETVDTVYLRFGPYFGWFEFGSIAIFSVEYIARVWACVEAPGASHHRPMTTRLRYMVSPVALADLVAILPALLGTLVMLDLRWLRLFRLLRLFKLTRYWSGLRLLADVVRQEAQVLGASMFVLLVIMLLASGLMHVVEHRAQPEAFGSIPVALWWTVITLTTVGYGDVVPVTGAGKLVAGCISLIGIAMVAMPAGILAAGFAEHARRSAPSRKRSARAERNLRSRLKEEQETGAAVDTERADRHCPHCGKPFLLSEDSQVDRRQQG